MNPLATLRLKTDDDGLYVAGKVWLCGDGLREVFDVPEEARVIRLSAYPRPAKDRAKVEMIRLPLIYATEPGAWIVDNIGIFGDEMREKLDRLAKKHKRTVFYVECEWE